MKDSIEIGKQRIKRYEEECEKMFSDLFEDNADNESCTEILRDYQCLHYAFLYRLEYSEYTDTEIKDCFWGMSALLHARINRMFQENDLTGNDEPDFDNMSLEEMKEVLSSQRDQIIISMVALQLFIRYTKIFHSVVVLDFDGMINEVKERLKEDPEFGDKLISEADNEIILEGYDFELCCTKLQAKKLEKLMRLEFPEFDVLLGRREKETVTEDKDKSMPQADYETIEVKFKS